MSLRCLVTGGAGFIGSHIVEELLNLGHFVRIIDDLSTGNIKNIEQFLPRVDFIENSITNKEIVKLALENIDVVFHLAAKPFVMQTITEPLESTLVNFNGTLNLLEYSRKSNVRAFIFSSSSAVYGNTEIVPVREDLTPAPISPYATAKLSSEYYVTLYAQLYNLSGVSLRYMNVFGERQNPKSEYSAVIPKFISKILNNEMIEIFGDGEQTRDFVFIKNIVQANIKVMNKLLNQELNSGVLNIGTGRATSINELVKIISEELSINPKVQYQNTREGEIKHSNSDISRAAKFLGYEPEISFTDGLKQLIEYFRISKNN